MTVKPWLLPLGCVAAVCIVLFVYAGPIAFSRQTTGWITMSVIALLILSGWLSARLERDYSELNFRLLHPLFNEVEKRLGARIPEQIVALFKDHRTILQNDFYILDPVEDEAVWLIATFLPVDARAVDEEWPRSQRGFFFAKTGHDDYYYVPLDTRHVHPLPVFIVRAQCRAAEKVADAIEDFLHWPRVPAVEYHQSAFPNEPGASTS